MAWTTQAEVLDVEPLGHPVEGVDQRVAQGRLGHHPLELLGQRRLALLDHGLDRAQGGVPGLERGGDEGQGLGQLGLERLAAGGRP